MVSCLFQCVKFHPNEAYIATGGADRTVRLWMVSDARLVRILCGHRGVVRTLAFSPSGAHLASAGNYLFLFLVCVLCLNLLLLHKSIFLGDDKKIKVWDIAACSCIHEYKGHHGKVTALDWSSIGKPSLTNRVLSDPSDPLVDNSLLCSAGMDGIVKMMTDCNSKNKYVFSFLWNNTSSL